MWLLLLFISSGNSSSVSSVVGKLSSQPAALLWCWFVFVNTKLKQNPKTSQHQSKLQLFEAGGGYYYYYYYIISEPLIHYTYILYLYLIWPIQTVFLLCHLYAYNRL